MCIVYENVTDFAREEVAAPMNLYAPSVQATLDNWTSQNIYFLLPTSFQLKLEEGAICRQLGVLRI